MVSALTRKAVDAATKAALQIALRELPAIATSLVRQWNAMALRDEMDRARSAINAEFIKNRRMAALIYEKYEHDMRPEVAALYREIMGKYDDQAK